MLRHEVLSGILAMQVPSFRAWLLEQYSQANLMVAVWVAMGHHLKIGLGKDGKPAGCIAEISDETGDELAIYTNHNDFRAVLKMGNEYLGLPDTLPELPQENWSKTELKQALINLQAEFDEFAQQLDEENQEFVAAVKATVIAADLAGSALPVAGYNLEDWIRQVLALVLSKNDIQALLDRVFRVSLYVPFKNTLPRHRIESC